MQEYLGERRILGKAPMAGIPSSMPAFRTVRRAVAISRSVFFENLGANSPVFLSTTRVALANSASAARVEERAVNWCVFVPTQSDYCTSQQREETCPCPN